MADPSTAPSDRGVVVGGDVMKSIIVTGDHNQIFAGGYECLRDAFINPRSVFERVNLDQFVGREWLLAQVDAFLHDQDRGYFILEAQAGLGKTVFLAWLVQERYYIHHFIGLAPRVEAGLKNLTAQLIRVWELRPYAVSDVLPGAAEQSYFLQNLLFEAARRRDVIKPDEKIVLVVDALDEASAPEGQNRLGLPQVLPEGVFFIVSQRPGPVTLPQVEAPLHTFCLIADSDENQADMRRFLKQIATCSSVAKALRSSDCTPEQFTTTLLQKCGGVWIYLHYVVEDIKRRKRSSLDLDDLPDDLTRYYARYWASWRSKSEEEWYETYLPILSTLAAAKDPVSSRELAAWAEVDIPDWLLRQLLRVRWRPFLAVIGGDREDYYQFYHTTLREFFEGRGECKWLPTGEREFLEELKQATIDARRRIIESLRRDIRNTQEPETVRRAAASRLTRLNWLTYVENVPHDDEMLTYLGLFARYVGFPVQHMDLAKMIGEVLKVSLPDRQRAQLLVYRAGMLGQLGESSGEAEFLDAAAEAYEAARQIVSKLIESQTSLPEDYKVFARVQLGFGNVAMLRAEVLTELGDQARRRKLLQEAVDLCLAAAKSAQLYGQDIILESNVYNQLSHIYALLHSWAEAEESYHIALEILERGREEDSEVYAGHYARGLETAIDVHLRKGQHLASSEDGSQALTEYETAYRLAREEFAMLERSVGESEDMVIARMIAHINSGDCLWAMSKCSGCDEPQAMAKRAWVHWQAALEIAHDLGISEHVVAKLSMFYGCQL